MLWMIGSALALRAGYFPALSRFFTAHPAAKALFITPTLLLPLAITAGIFTARARRRSIADLIAAGGWLCLSCRYRLDRSLAAGHCPECGHPFDPGSLKRGWGPPSPPPAYEIDWPAPVAEVVTT